MRYEISMVAEQEDSDGETYCEPLRYCEPVPGGTIRVFWTLYKVVGAEYEAILDFNDKRDAEKAFCLLS